jgi:hypothetical protein
MNTTTASKIPSQKTTPKNGSPTTEATDHPEQPTTAAPSTPTPPAAPAIEKKPVTVMLTETLHRKVKITAELSGISLSDLVEEQLKTVVKERLPGLLAKLDTES